MGMEISSHLRVIDYHVACMHRTEFDMCSRRVSRVVFHVIFTSSCPKREMDKCQCFLSHLLEAVGEFHKS